MIGKLIPDTSENYQCRFGGDLMWQSVLLSELRSNYRTTSLGRLSRELSAECLNLEVAIMSCLQYFIGYSFNDTAFSAKVI